MIDYKHLFDILNPEEDEPGSSIVRILSGDSRTNYMRISSMQPDSLSNLSRILSLIQSLVESLSCTAWLAVIKGMHGLGDADAQRYQV